MKGLYLSNLYEQKTVGYEAKILGQIRGLIAFGLELELISFSETGQILLQEKGRATFPNTVDRTVLGEKSKFIFIRRKRLLSETFKRARTTSLDFLYIRYPRSDPFYLFFLFMIKAVRPEILIFSEFPTFPYDQEKTEGSYLKQTIIRVLDMVTRRYLKYFIDRAVSVNYEKKIFGMKSININNGISVDNFTLKKSRPTLTAQQTVNLIGVANVKPWHGYDRIITGLGKYYRCSTLCRKVVFHVVGACEPILGSFKELAIDQGVEDYVVFHPPVKGIKLDDLFNASDVGVSTLGAHRIGLHELSPLKTREYCARGLPFLLGYKDPDFPEGFDYALECPADDSPVDIKKIVLFYESICQEPDNCKKIREHAENELDWSRKMIDVAQELVDLGATITPQT